LITAGTGIYFLGTRILRPLRDFPREKISITEIVGYSWPISISTILIMIIGQVDYLILGIYHPTAFVGIYRIYIQITVLLQLILSSTARIYKPVISELTLQEDLPEIRETYQRISKWVLSLTMLGFLVILLYGSRVIGLFFTDAYATFPIALTILTLGTLLKASFGPGGMTLEAFGNTKLILINSVVMLLTNVGLGFILIPNYGILGAAIATGVTIAVSGLISFLEINFLYQMLPFSLTTIKNIGIGVFTGILFYGIGLWLNTDNNVLLVGLILAISIVYGYGFFLTGSLDKVDRDVLRKVIAQFSLR
jgi:O-antigen/teichoic acid export membrane protein